MWFVVTVWDMANERHATKCFDYEDAERLAHAAIANGAEYATVENPHTGQTLLDLTA